LVRQGLIQLGKIIISALLIGYLLFRIGIHRILDHIASADPLLFAAAIGIFLISHIVGSYQWYVLLCNEKVPITWPKALSFYFVGLFLNNFLVSSMGGDIFRMVDIKRHSEDLPGAVATVFLDRLAGFFLLSTLAVLSGPWIIIEKGLSSHLTLLILFLVVSWSALLFLLFCRSAARPFARIFRKAVPEKFSSKAREIYDRIYAFGRQKSVVRRVLLLSVLIQSMRIMTHYVLACSLGVHVSPAYFFLIVPVIAIAASLPVSFGGIGLREQTGVILFGMIGIPAVQAFSIEFMAYISAILTSIPGGIVFAVRRNVKRHRNSK